MTNCPSDQTVGSAREDHRRSSRLSERLVAAVVLAVLVTATAAAQGDPNWRVWEGDCHLELLSHRRVEAGRTESAKEHLRLRMQHGTQGYALLPIDAVSVIAELKIGVRMRSDRAGGQLQAQVILPRSVDPRTGAPFTLFISGDVYEAKDVWQMLSLEQALKKVEEQTRLLRASAPVPIDAREAYINLILVNVYAEPGARQVWLEDPVIEGPSKLNGLQSAIASTPLGKAPRADTAVQLEAGFLSAGGYPFFPIIATDSGDPWDAYARLGFNTIRLRSPATVEQISLANQLGLWLISPPPRLEAWAQIDAANLSASFSRVLAWDLGQQLTSEHLEQVRQRADAIRNLESPARPILCGADVDLPVYSRHVDIVMHQRNILGSTFPPKAYWEWLRQRPRLSHPAGVHWSVIPHEPSATIEHQLAALRLGTAAAVELEQVRSLAFIPIALGFRGIEFDLRSHLSGPEPSAVWQRLMLKQVIGQLQLVQPWVARAHWSDAARTDRSDYLAATAVGPRSSLGVIVRLAADAQYVAPPPEETDLQVVLTGVPQGSEIYRFGMSALQPISSRRVAGGTQVTLDHPRNVELVLVSRSPADVRSVSERLRSLSIELVETRQQQLQEELKQIRPLLHARPDAPGRDLEELWQAVTAAHEELTTAIARRDHALAHQWADRALGHLADIRHRYWKVAVAELPSPVASPLATQSATIAAHVHLWRTMPAAGQGVNLLSTGECEDLQRMIASGWQTFEGDSGARIAARLATGTNVAGQHSLELVAEKSSDGRPVQMGDEPLVWVNSAPLKIGGGQLVRIDGWVNVPKPITGCDDGLMIFDSLGGTPMAYRFAVTRGWQRFTMLRATDVQEELVVTVALTGLGRAYLDELTITPLPKVNTMQQATRPERRAALLE